MTERRKPWHPPTMIRHGWKKVDGYEHECPAWRREVFGHILRVWWANYRFWGCINNGTSIGSTRPNEVASKLEAKLADLLREHALVLQRDSVKNTL